jgi:hypothetical protein
VLSQHFYEEVTQLNYIVTTMKYLEQQIFYLNHTVPSVGSQKYLETKSQYPMQKQSKKGMKARDAAMN